MRHITLLSCFLFIFSAPSMSGIIIKSCSTYFAPNDYNLQIRKILLEYGEFKTSMTIDNPHSPPPGEIVIMGVLGKNYFAKFSGITTLQRLIERIQPNDGVNFAIIHIGPLTEPVRKELRNYRGNAHIYNYLLHCLNRASLIIFNNTLYSTKTDFSDFLNNFESAFLATGN